MNVREFKAWLNGFSEAMGECPTPEQWAKIKKEIDGLSTIGEPVNPYPFPRNPAAPVWVSPKFTPAPGELDFSITC